MRDLLLSAGRRLAADAVHLAWRGVSEVGKVRHGSRTANRFARYGPGTVIGFPAAVLHGVERIEVGAETLIGADVTLSAGMPVPLDDGRADPLITIGDRCVLGKSTSIVAHERIEIGDDTFGGQAVYITDQNHGYEELDIPIGRQMWKNGPVRIGAGCWLGHGSVILPGTTIGDHVVVAAKSVVRGEVPSHCVVVGTPARIIRRHVPGVGWVATDPDGTPRSV